MHKCGRIRTAVGSGLKCCCCWIRSHLELQDEDYVSSELEEADTVLIPSGSNGEDGAAGEAVEQPVRRSVRLDPDFDEITGTRLVQKRVIIREGKLSGQIGKVLFTLSICPYLCLHPHLSVYISLFTVPACIFLSVITSLYSPSLTGD